jgi:hypothetical protein
MNERIDQPVDRTGMFGMVLSFLTTRSIHVAADLGLTRGRAHPQPRHVRLNAELGP